MLVAISFASAVNTERTAKKKESPLFGIRTERSVNKGIKESKEQLKVKFIGERLFFLPFLLSTYGNDMPVQQLLPLKITTIGPICVALTKFPPTCLTMGWSCCPWGQSFIM